MPPSANTAGGRRVTRWTRESIIERILEWNDRFGEPPCSADWNPSLARWRAQEWRVERYRDGSWPSTNAAKRPFDGSFDAAVRAAGLEPHRSGPRRRPAGVARPAVQQREPQAPRSVDEALLDAAQRVRAMERRVAELEREVAVAERRARGARERVQVVEREAVEQVDMLTADANARVRAAYDQAQAAVADTHEARRAARAAEARAADAEARAKAAERLVEAASADSAAVGSAMAAARAAENRAAEAERRARELATLVCGEPRQLTRGELARLRDAGPTGPAVMANALRTLHKARAAGDRRGLTDALGDVASAAVGWRDRL